jgi:hypothetical protein
LIGLIGIMMVMVDEVCLNIVRDSKSNFYEIIGVVFVVIKVKSEV